MPFKRTLAPALLALAVCSAPLAASAQNFSDAQRGEIETIIKNYLVTHPEVLEEASAELSKRQQAAEAEKHANAVAENAKTLFNSPRGITLGNQNGDVNFVEFFDYNCGYCKHAMGDMLSLLKSDPKLRVVLKEFPVLGPGSVGPLRLQSRSACRIRAARSISTSTRSYWVDVDRPTRLARWPRRRTPVSTSPVSRRI